MNHLETLKHSLYIDGTHEDTFLAYLINVAKGVIVNALDYTPNDTNVVFTHAVILLAGHYYRNRIEVAEEGNVNQIPFGVNSLIEQLRGATPNED